MTCVILQPSYIPWRGVFHQMQKADVFIFYDDVQYDVDGWRNRNRIKTQQGPQWLTIPVNTRNHCQEATAIRDVEMSTQRPWRHKHAQSLRQSYAKAPFFRRYESLVERWYSGDARLLADVTIPQSIEIARELGITKTRFVRSSELAASGSKTERLAALLRSVDADHYISGPAARAYLDEPLLAAHGITLEYMSYDYPEYPQLHGGYDPHVSILDLLFMTGPDAGRYIWQS